MRFIQLFRSPKNGKLYIKAEIQESTINGYALVELNLDAREPSVRKFLEQNFLTADREMDLTTCQYSETFREFKK